MVRRLMGLIMGMNGDRSDMFEYGFILLRASMCILH